MNKNNPWLEINWQNTIATGDSDAFALLGARIAIVKNMEHSLEAKKIIGKSNLYSNTIEELKKLFDKGFNESEDLKNYFIDIYSKYNSIGKERKNSKGDNYIQFDTLPEPFTGDIDSEIVCLNMNPGGKDEKYENCSNNKVKLLEESLLSFDIENYKRESMWYRLDGHRGCNWLKERTKEITHLMCGEFPRFLFIEYFPYHSVSSFSFPRYLPSYEYTDCLIKNAFEKKKLIIVMRNEKRWNERIKLICGKSLDDCDNVAFLISPQNAYLTNNNFIPPKKGIYRNIKLSDFIIKTNNYGIIQ